MRRAVITNVCERTFSYGTTHEKVANSGSAGWLELAASSVAFSKNSARTAIATGKKLSPAARFFSNLQLPPLPIIQFSTFTAE